jgi:malonate decarboxylase beta subunit
VRRDLHPRHPESLSWFEASARQRIAALVDTDSFVEELGPEQRETSPHLGGFDLPVQFDDGIVVGQATLGGRPVLIAAQEGRFMGGSIGEVHGAKLTGLLRVASTRRRNTVILFDTGGVRLQEANAGEVAVAEILRALVAARLAGARVIGLIGGSAGCFGGGSLIAACCSSLVVSEQARIGVSGPTVIESCRGVEEFDSMDRALVWRTMGGKHRYLIGGADHFALDTAGSFRAATLGALEQSSQLTLTTLQREQIRLETRLAALGSFSDAPAIWAALGIANASEMPELPMAEFELVASAHRVSADDAR